MFRKQIHLENHHENWEKDAGKKFPQVVFGFEASVPLDPREEGDGDGCDAIQ